MAFSPDARFRFEKQAFLLKNPRVAGSGRGGPGLPGPGGRATAGEPSRP